MDDRADVRRAGLGAEMKQMVVRPGPVLAGALFALLVGFGLPVPAWAQGGQLLPPDFSAPGQAVSPEIAGAPKKKTETTVPTLPPPVADGPSVDNPGMALDPQATFGGGNNKLPSEGFEPMDAPKTPEELEAEIRSDAFTAALGGLLPMRVKEIRQLLEYYDQTREAVEVPVYPYPKPEVGVINLSLDPGVTPPVIKLSPGHVTTLSLLDVTGAPWPIQDVTWAGNFEIVQPEEGGHVIRITPMSEFAYGNISMRLLTLKTPITFTFQVQRDSVQYRVDARVPEYGPFASMPLIDGGISLVAGDGDLTAVLDGAPPDGAKRLAVSGVDGRTTAYEWRGQTFVRTPLTLLSPGWDKSVRSADGMTVYALANSPVLLLSDQGRVVRAHIARDEDGSDGQHP
jgi:intracellular multiplication protein IcmK